MAGTHPTRSRWLGALISGAIVAIFSLILLRHNPFVFWNDDYQISILPVFADVARSWDEGHFPLLSPYSWVCGNLAGEFEYGTFSVFINTAIVLIWKFPFTFAQQAAALSITHLFVLAAGAFLLAYDHLGNQLRPWRPDHRLPLSIFVGLVAALNGWIICWGATDWFGALGAFAWLPWAWWGLERALDTNRTRYRFLWPALFVYLLVTGGFPYTVVMLVLLIAWLCVKSLVQNRNPKLLMPMLFGAALGFGLSAPALLAILAYVPGSAREVQPGSAHFQWLVPSAAWPGLILPCWTVQWSNFSNGYVPHVSTELACGLAAPIAILVALIRHARIFIRKVKWELILLGLLFLLSMLPTAGLFRWSFRWLPFVHLVMAICAAQAMQTLFRERLRRPGSPIPAAALLLLTVVTIVMSMAGKGGPDAYPLSWIFLQLAVMWLVSEFFLHNSSSRAWWPVVITLLAFLATYLCLPTNCGVPRFNLSQQLLDPTPLDPDRLYLSIYPQPESAYRVEDHPDPVGQTTRIGSTSMWAGLRFVNGYSPIRPAGVSREFATSIHGEIDPWTGESLLKERAGADGKLALLGIDGIIVASQYEFEPQPSSEWVLVTATPEGRVFHRNGPPLARVRSVAAVDSRTGEPFATASVSRIVDSRNYVEANVDVPPGTRPALMVFSRPYFPGYRARIGDRKLTVESENGLIPAVKIPAGTAGKLVLQYRPAWLVFGTVVASICATMFVAGLWLRLRTA